MVRLTHNPNFAAGLTKYGICSEIFSTPLENTAN